MAEHNELTVLYSTTLQQQQALPKINIKICRYSHIVPHLLGLKLSRLNDAQQVERRHTVRHHVSRSLAGI